MNAQQLRNSILQEAIEGRLVPQDPNDEPAIVLLERIREEKKQLVKAGKLKKKDLEEAPISEDEIPFDIPDSWEWVRLADVFEHSSGKQLRASDTEGTLHEYITTSNLYWGRFELNKLKSMYYKDSEIEKCTAKKGDLLVCEGGDIGRSAIWSYDYDICLQNHVHRLRPYDSRYTIFVFYIMWYYKSVGLIGGKGIGIQGLSASALKTIIIPLPPLAEQKRIVAKIEELLPKVEEYGKAQEELDKLNEELPECLKKSVLQEAISGKLVPQDPNDEPASVLLNRIREEKKRLVKEGKLKKKDLEETPISEDEKPFEIPKGWEWVRIDDYANKVTDFVASGSFATLRENVKYYKEENYALLVKTKDFQSDFGNDLTYTDKHGYEFLSNSNLYGGELILSNVGSIGKVFIVPKLSRRMTLAPNAIMVRLWNEDHRDWLYYLFQTAFGLSLLYNISSATAIRKFNKSDFKKLVIPLPPLAEQRRIVAKIEEAFKAIDALS